MAEDCIEDQLLRDSSVRLVVEQGGQVRSVLMPDEFRAVKVRGIVPAAELTEATVREVLGPFGDVEKIRRSTRQARISRLFTLCKRMPSVL